MKLFFTVALEVVAIPGKEIQQVFQAESHLFIIKDN